MFRFIATGALMATGVTASANAWTQPSPKLTEPPKPRQELGVPKKASKTYHLPQSKSTLSLPEGYKAILISNHGIEAMVHDDSFKNFIVFKSCVCGYIPLDNWSDLDPTTLLENFSQDIKEKSQKTREKEGVEVRSVAWVQEPTLDRQANTVYFSLRIDDSQGKSFLHSTVVRLNREGCLHIVWMGPLSDYKEDSLNIVVQAHTFDPGYCYSDYIPGDKISDTGIATILLLKD